MGALRHVRFGQCVAQRPRHGLCEHAMPERSRREQSDREKRFHCRHHVPLRVDACECGWMDALKVELYDSASLCTEVCNFCSRTLEIVSQNLHGASCLLACAL